MLCKLLKIKIVSLENLIFLIKIIIIIKAIVFNPLLQIDFEIKALRNYVGNFKRN
jgi:hypothetical protein